MATLGFAGFLRWDDLSQIKACDIDFHLGFVKIFLEKCKNDQFREGSWICIAETETRYFPVSLLKRFLHIGEHSLDSFLFRKISHTKAGFKLRKQKLSYSRALELFKNNWKGFSWIPVCMVCTVYIQEGPALQLLLGFWIA